MDYKPLWRGGYVVAVPPQNTSRTCPSVAMSQPVTARARRAVRASDAVMKRMPTLLAPSIF
ncbi:hypothetical protein [Noviherbaspirillum malthae]|uniref:hypothetical protein n=1 Tax=Noviherbaspirillum malthae TaxID=1260987 RepID=UPI003F6A224C